MKNKLQLSAFVIIILRNRNIFDLTVHPFFNLKLTQTLTLLPWKFLLFSTIIFLYAFGSVVALSVFFIFILIFSQQLITDLHSRRKKTSKSKGVSWRVSWDYSTHCLSFPSPENKNTVYTSQARTKKKSEAKIKGKKSWNVKKLNLCERSKKKNIFFSSRISALFWAHRTLKETYQMKTSLTTLQLHHRTMLCCVAPHIY